MKRFLVLLLLIIIAVLPGEAAQFVPNCPVMPVSGVKEGMRGSMLTVLKGTKPVSLPIEVAGVIPEGNGARRRILIRLSPSKEHPTGRVAQGMSGSPVFVGDRLIGALAAGWVFSDNSMALVTPIADMAGVFLGGGGAVTTAGASAPLTVEGLSASAASRLSGIADVSPGAGGAGDLPLNGPPFSPGEAVSALLVWGDVNMFATGTVTAVSKDGRFLAFGHPFMEMGDVGFPVARAYVHGIVDGSMSPFKLASPVAMVGTATQDRPDGIGGRMGYFAPSVTSTLVFRDADGRGERRVKNFRVARDAFLSAKLIEGVYGGLIDDQWGRKGEGSAVVTLRVDGAGLPGGWTRTNAFFSGTSIGDELLRETAEIIDTFLTQPFKEVFPIGFRLDVSVTREPRLLTIENVIVSEDAAPGGRLPLEVVLRPWRKEPIKKRFEVVIPRAEDDAPESCELVVRGGGVNSMSQTAIDEGWKAVDGFDRLLAEMGAADANNELVVELNYKKDSKKDDKKSKDGRRDDEEREFLSETKSRRIKEGTLRISKTEYVVEGFMKRVINLGSPK
ncbi:MAG: hypothetical protein LBR38_00340 [Synergistaceae bacterium]|nr:hypothetical protein [Synergistaceae bacterium]